ncbi:MULTISPECIES: LacI family DNA-binding transcriptional regulator [unclassified Herbaspirillum]|uniref:LacI family DNA-binding transcriptional regulator n=1 Tax=unclassified Herbaspirillum TaxID=2624150 RepID=UPI001E5EC0D5|nr:MULTISPECIES: LacI family DNA-binding transcriptional regulator [unclassified Herbaspirillum]
MKHTESPSPPSTEELPVQGGSLSMLSNNVTLKDVARVAGVSPITVSRAIHRPELVKPHTVEVVQRAVRVTGYIPNQLAGALTGRKTRLIAAVVPQISNSIFVETIQALSSRLWRANYQLLLGLSGYHNTREEELMSAILSRRPDGIVLTGIRHAPEIRQKLLSTGTPVVEIWDQSLSPIDMVVGFSHEKVGEAMATHLLERGYRHIAMLWLDDDRSTRRRIAFNEKLQSHGMTAVATILSPSPATLQHGREGLAELLAQGQQFDAIACGSDPLAHGVLTESFARGMRVPDQLGVIGFGDFDFAAHTHPALTTVKVDRQAIGELAADALLQKIAGKEPKQRIIDVGFEVVVRGTT